MQRPTVVVVFEHRVHFHRNCSAAERPIMEHASFNGLYTLVTKHRMLTNISFKSNVHTKHKSYNILHVNSIASFHYGNWRALHHDAVWGLHHMIFLPSSFYDERCYGIHPYSHYRLLNSAHPQWSKSRSAVACSVQSTISGTELEWFYDAAGILATVLPAERRGLCGSSYSSERKPTINLLEGETSEWYNCTWTRMTAYLERICHEWPSKHLLFSQQRQYGERKHNQV